jgi:hypothetical protein
VIGMARAQAVTAPANMIGPRQNVIFRLAGAIAGHLLLFAWYRDLALWNGQEHEAWKYFRASVVSGLTLVFTVSAIVRGEPPEKVAGFILSLLPALCLLGALIGCLRGMW